jgi:hypothetical protein
MTQPTPVPRSSKEERVKRFLERGGKTTLDTRNRSAAPTVSGNTSASMTANVPGTEGMVKQIRGGGGDLDAHVVLTVTYTSRPDFSLLVFVNTPNAAGDTPITVPGFVGSVAIFPHDVDAHHDGAASFRLPATDAVAKTSAGGPVTVTIVPITAPGRQLTAQTVTVTATVELVVSKVEKGS